MSLVVSHKVATTNIDFRHQQSVSYLKNPWGHCHISQVEGIAQKNADVKISFQIPAQNRSRVEKHSNISVFTS